MSATITLSEAGGGDAILASNIKYIVTERSGSGFSILLAEPAIEDISFSWIALAIKNIKISSSENTSQPGAVSTVTIISNPEDNGSQNANENATSTPESSDAPENSESVNSETEESSSESQPESQSESQPESQETQQTEPEPESESEPETATTESAPEQTP